MTISVDRRKVNQPPQVEDKLTLTEDELIEPKYQNVWLKTNLMFSNASFAVLGMKFNLTNEKRDKMNRKNLQLPVEDF